MKGQIAFETQPFELDLESQRIGRSGHWFRRGSSIVLRPQNEWLSGNEEVWQGEVSRNKPEYIRWVQRALNQILGLRLPLSGVINARTRSAIRSFQQRQKLVADGIVGPKTEVALIAQVVERPPVRLGIADKAGRVERCVDLSPLGTGFRRRPTVPHGDVVSLVSTPDKRDILLIDFDIDDDTLKPAHIAALDNLLKFMAEDFGRRRGPGKRWTIHIDGRASRTGTSEHNRSLSRNRAAQVQRYLCFHLFDHVRATDQLEFESSVDFNTEFHGFDEAVQPGESARERSVRVAVTRPGITPPPLPIFPSCRFNPTRDGFKFDNSFSVPAALTKLLSRPPISTVLSGLGISIGTGGFGLCGGMVTLARDHFRFGVPIPAVTSPPPIGSSLFNALVDRQLDSLNLNVGSVGPNFGAPIFKFARLMKLPVTGAGSVAELTAREFGVVRSALASGRLRILGLFTDAASKTGALTDNHQVLARCLTQRSQKEFAVHIYDPNFHDCDDITLEVKLIGREVRVTEVIPRCPTGGPSVEPVPGFFVMPYRPIKP
jgi:outer membrane protein OmpA-like peptidoglycan-associated protein